MNTTSTVYCYHCRKSHPREDMRQVDSKSGKRWRCYQSIEAAKSNKASREAFGKQVTQANKEQSQKLNRLSLAAKEIEL